MLAVGAIDSHLAFSDNEDARSRLTVLDEHLTLRRLEFGSEGGDVDHFGIAKRREDGDASDVVEMVAHADRVGAH